MTSTTVSIALDAILVTLLLIGGITDWRERIIPHWLNITIALLAPISWWNHGFHLWPDVAWQVGLSAIAISFFMIFQAIGQMGGGDVKLLGALALWFNWKVFLTMLWFTSVGGAVLTIGMLIAHRAMKRPGKPEYPYGIAIVVGTVIVIGVPYLRYL